MQDHILPGAVYIGAERSRDATPPGLFWICAYKWLPMEIVPMTREVKGAKSTPVVETSELALL